MKSRSWNRMRSLALVRHRVKPPDAAVRPGPGCQCGLGLSPWRLLAKDGGWIALLVLFLGSVSVGWAGTDYYTAGFFTRGADAAFYIDSGDPVFDPFYVPLDRVSLLPRLTVLAIRDDNLFMNAKDRKTRGTVVQVIPGVALVYGRPEARHIFLDYGAVIPVYEDDDRLDDQISHMIMLGGAYLTTKSHVYGRVGFRRLENVDTLVGARIVKEDYIANVALEYRVSGKTLIGGLGSFDRHEFDSDQYVDYDRYYGAVRGFYEITPRSQVFIQGGMGRDDLARSDDGDADYYDVSLGVRGKPSPKTQVSGRVGYQWRTFDAAELEDIEHWIASLYGEVNPFGFSTFSSELYADLRPAVNARGSTSIDQRWTGSVSRRLWVERLRGNASLYVGRVDYRSPVQETAAEVPDGFVFDRRRDEYWGYTLGLDWWWKHNVSVGLAYSYTENRAARRSSEAIRDANSYDAGRWLLRASWNY